MSRLSNWQKGKVIFGGASISGEGGGYGFGNISASESISLLDFVFERGVQVFDTAPIYGFGESEKRLGEFAKSKRDQVKIISKSGVDWHESKRVNMTNEPGVTVKMLEASLTRLNTDYIDLFMVHWPDENVDIRKTLEVLVKAKEEQKILQIGLCNTNEQELAKAFEVTSIEAVQSQLNFFERGELDFIENVSKRNMSFMSWGTLDKGILTDRVNSSRTFDSSDCRSWAPWWKGMDKERRYNAIEKVRPLLAQHGHTFLELALSHNILTKGLEFVLTGGKTQEQWEGIWKAEKNLLSRELLDKCIEIASES